MVRYCILFRSFIGDMPFFITVFTSFSILSVSPFLFFSYRVYTHAGIGTWINYLKNVRTD
jgi:hypothetical protein